MSPRFSGFESEARVGGSDVVDGANSPTVTSEDIFEGA